MHVHCIMLGMESMVVDLGIMSSTKVTVSQLKEKLKDKFEHLLGEISLYSPDATRQIPQQRDAVSNEPRDGKRMSHYSAEVSKPVVSRIRSSTLPGNVSRPLSNLTSKEDSQKVKPSTLVFDSNKKLDDIDNVKSSSTKEEAPRNYFPFTFEPPQFDCPLLFSQWNLKANFDDFR